MKVICWIKEVCYTLYYNAPISGHDFIETDNGLVCEICGYKSKGGK